MSAYSQFQAHSIKQQNCILSDHKLTLALTGIQFGKTTSGAVWMKRQICTHTGPDDAFLITAPTYKIMRQSTLPAFLKHMDGMGTYNKVDAIFSLYTGGQVYMRTATEPDSVVGITNVRAIWGDEAGKYSLYFWENMQARASFKEAPILLTTTPYTTNWMFRDFIRPIKKGNQIEGLCLIQASSNENPYFPQSEYDMRRRTMDPRRFAALYEGQFERMHGLVYDCFLEDVHIIKPVEMPVGTQFVGGIDWGYTDPFVLNVRAITPSGHHFLVSEFYKTGLTISDMLVIGRQKKQAFGISLFYADPSQPGLIEEFNRNGLPCVPANNDIRRGVDTHYELIKSDRYRVFEGLAPHTIDEYSTYHYPSPDELGPDEDSKDQVPVGQDDHTQDVERYISIMTATRTAKLAPVVPEDKPKVLTHEQRIAQLKKGRNRFHGSESW